MGSLLQSTELEYLRFFFQDARHFFGPASPQIYDQIEREYESSTGHAVPEEYRRDVE